jgi:hypothetical protein
MNVFLVAFFFFSSFSRSEARYIAMLYLIVFGSGSAGGGRSVGVSRMKHKKYKDEVLTRK